MTEQQIQILTSVAIKNAVELMKGSTGSIEECAEMVDKLARALFTKHTTWIKELQNENSPKAN